MSYPIDDLDKRIVHALVRDARNTSAPEIAEEMDVSAGTIRNRITKLEEHGVIRGYHAAIDYERCEGLLTNLFRCSTSISEQERLAKHLLRIPGVVNVREVMSGHGNLRVKVVGTDTRDLTRTAQKLTNLGIDIEDEDLLQEEYYHPYHPFGPEEPPEESIPTTLNLTKEDEATITVTAGAPIVGETLQNANQTGLIDEDVLVVAIERDETVITPKGKTTIQSGDIVRVFSHNGIPNETIAVFRNDES
jgi:Lrp/AsnC family leucine-responsive transcriptional regulator